ncbi:hypothetical protein DNL40_08680 [Xylanimonas oleitrophica]|uniref:Uncharacterized protein n=1 Tax=Xylanimonas oleitrophica TaxID=2607479 RepID=A0A2W5WYZ4_9MICO|nr:hypothetical protein DNL40_08680 [Xylanimonas oleitrophica]
MDARAALAVVERTRTVNAQRLQRPRRYWLIAGALLAVHGLIPLTSGWPLVASLAPLALLVTIVTFAARRQPSAVRKMRLRGHMWLPLLGLALAAGVLQAVSTVLYGTYGLWWTPVVAAAMLFGGTLLAGPAIDRHWAREVSGVER